MIAIPLASLAVGALIGWCAKVFADAGIICDTAGNGALKCAECQRVVTNSSDLTQFSRCWSCYGAEVNDFLKRGQELLPSPHTDLIVNTLTPLGFLAVQLRLCGDYANHRGVIDDAGRALDAAVESLKKDLTPCVDCGQINSNHLVKCAGWDGALKMDWVAKEPKGGSDDAAAE